MGFDLDHTSFAVRDALAYGARLRRECGAVPIAGEALAEFRYLLLHCGPAEGGARIELLEPTGAGFLSRFLGTSGEGPHHVTIDVPDLPSAVARTRDLGLTVVGENYAHPSWREAFVMPDAVHGTVIQLASSDKSYPTPADLHATRDRDMTEMPAVAGATDSSWWTSLWETAPAEQAGWLGDTHLVSGDPALSRELFGGVLGAQVADHEGGFTAVWPSGRLRVLADGKPGVCAVERFGPGADWSIGDCRFAGVS